MKRTFLAAACAAAAFPAFADDTYTTPVTSNGVDYLCSAEAMTVDGVTGRRCILDPGADPVAISSQGPLIVPGLFGAGAGLGVTAAVTFGVIGTVVVATSLQEESDDTNSTTGSN